MITISNTTNDEDVDILSRMQLLRHAAPILRRFVTCKGYVALDKLNTYV